MDNPFSISDENLKTILDSYTSWIEKDEREKSYPEEQRKRDKDLRRTLLSKAYLSKTPKKELIKKVMEYSRTLEGPAHINLGLPRVTNEINNIKQNILYLIESKDDPFKKAANILEGKQKISFFSRSFWSPIFNSLYPKDLPNWNNKTERFLIKLGVNIRRRGLTTEDKYRLISRVFTYFKKIDPKHDFYSINHLMHYGTEIPEGNDLISKITGEKEIPAVSYWRVILPYGRKGVSIWPACRDKELIAIGYPNKPDEANVQHLKRMRIGDKVVAYLMNGRVGGIGTISGEYEDYSETKPKSKDYFGGFFWRRRKVRWDRLPKEGDYWKLTSPQIVPGARMTIYKMTLDQYKSIIENLGLEKENGIPPAKRVWVEKTYVTGVAHRESGEKAFSKVIWSPRKSQDGKDIYKNMRIVSKGDVIIHLIDNKRISGVSIVRSESYNEVPGLSDSEWSGPAYLLELNDYRELEVPIEINNILAESNRERLIKIKSEGEVFYTSNLELRQGAYLTPCSKSLLSLINEVYYEKTEGNLPHISTGQLEEEPPEQLYPYEKLVVTKLMELSQPFKIKKLHFENPDIVEKQITNSLSTGKHLILIGPPGTGKSKLAKEICEHYVGSEHISSTASSDWSTFDTIGGYIPDEKGNLHFNSGLFLKCLQDEFDNPSNRWLIIDEINRADIDKAFGALFSALTGDSVTLSYSKLGNQVQIIGNPSSSAIVESYKYFVHPDWRIIATMNTFDKASLYEMSYAFMRRFAFIPIDVPSKISDDLIATYLKKWGLKSDQNVSIIATLWELINTYRKIGPAIVHDMYLYLQSGGEMESCVILYVLPQFEGIDEDKQIDFIKNISEQLETSGRKRIISFASDFFDIDIDKF